MSIFLFEGVVFITEENYIWNVTPDFRIFLGTQPCEICVGLPLPLVVRRFEWSQELSGRAGQSGTMQGENCCLSENKVVIVVLDHCINSTALRSSTKFTLNH